DRERRISATIMPPMPRDDTSAGAIRLRPTAPGDLAALFEIDRDPEGNARAGTKPRTVDVFLNVWERIFADPDVNARVIDLHGEIVGTINAFHAEGKLCVGYSIARRHWGKGIASRALTLFLAEEQRRPLHATILRDNAPSRRVLEKSGFRCTGFRTGEETDRYLPGDLADFVLD
ncbi:MAG: GNAT family N-acetyltransferase, partial [Planctomycetota bacterium]|nr:GNAT family N-acetyltransferase [Planctomycetota bacterium]